MPGPLGPKVLFKPTVSCPACAAALSLADGGQGLTTEYWTGRDRVFVCFCGACGWSGDIVLADRVIGHEAAE